MGIVVEILLKNEETEFRYHFRPEIGLGKLSREIPRLQGAFKGLITWSRIKSGDKAGHRSKEFDRIRKKPGAGSIPASVSELGIQNADSLSLFSLSHMHKCRGVNSQLEVACEA